MSIRKCRISSHMILQFACLQCCRHELFNRHIVSGTCGKPPFFNTLFFYLPMYQHVNTTMVNVSFLLSPIGGSSFSTTSNHLTKDPIVNPSILKFNISDHIALVSSHLNNKYSIVSSCPQNSSELNPIIRLSNSFSFIGIAFSMALHRKVFCSRGQLIFQRVAYTFLDI